MKWQILVLILQLGVSVVRSEFDQSCTTSFGQSGKCALVKDCEYALHIIRKDHRTDEDWTYLDYNVCGETTDKPPKKLVCCPLVHNVNSCGLAEVGKRIFGGNETTPGEYPWTGVIVYQVNRRKFSVNCGCTLLNSRWVLTAAHCISSIPRAWKIHRVRFNEWDTTKRQNCTIIEDKQICRQEYKVEQQFAHGDYQINSVDMKNDIGLLKTKTDVIFNDYVFPICLPFRKSIQTLKMNQQEFIVTGFGQTNEGNRPGIQRHVLVKGTDNSNCNKAFASLRIILSENQICAGGNEGEDSCRGDSGGALMLQDELVHYLIGVVSFGSYKCGEKDSPAVYTNVIKYLDWIEETIIHN